VAGGTALAFARGVAKLQTILGEHQDSVTAQAWLRSVRVSGRRAFAAGELIAMEHIAAEDARARWPETWKSIDRKRLREWIP
jgi:CHAD domain-containing protein